MVALSEHELKGIVKEALLELLQERRETVTELFSEVLEELLLVRAIQSEETSDEVSRTEIMQILSAN